MVFNGVTNQFYTTRLPYREDCLSHETYPEPIPLPLGHSAPASALFDAARRDAVRPVDPGPRPRPGRRRRLPPLRLARRDLSATDPRRHVRGRLPELPRARSARDRQRGRGRLPARRRPLAALGIPRLRHRPRRRRRSARASSCWPPTAEPESPDARCERAGSRSDSRPGRLTSQWRSLDSREPSSRRLAGDHVRRADPNVLTGGSCRRCWCPDWCPDSCLGRCPDWCRSSYR